MDSVKITRRILMVSIVVGAMVVALSFVSSCRQEDPSGPNVIIILSDALRSDHMGCYGYERDTTPHIDAFAKDAALFTHAFAQSPSTKPSITSLFTSHYPTQHKAIYSNNSLDPSLTTLAEVLRENHYRTAGFVENHIISKRFHYDRGFDTWEFNERTYVDKEKIGFAVTQKDKDKLFRDDQRFDNRILSWIKKQRKRPFFLYVHYIDPHSPYIAAGPFYNYFDKDYTGAVKGTTEEIVTNRRQFKENRKDLEHLVALYDDEIRYVDARFQRIIDGLEELEMLDRSIVIFLSDHGEGFLEHGRLFHSYGVYAELINMPLIIRYPPVFETGSEDDYVQHIDIFPTIMHILKIENSSLVLEGKSILDMPKESNEIVSEHLRVGWGTPQRCLIANGWKLVYDLEEDRSSLLFDINSDPLDARNAIKEHTDVAGGLEERLSNWLASLKDLSQDAPTVELDKKTKENLRSLGYIR